MGFLHVLCNSWVIAFVTYIVVAVSTSYTSLYINLVLFLFLFHAREFTSSLVNNAERGWEADLALKIKGNSNSLFQSWFAIRVPAECPILNVDVLCANCKLRAHGATGVGLTLWTLP